MTLTSFVFTELANTLKYGEGSYITLFLPSDVTALHRMKYGGGGVEVGAGLLYMCTEIIGRYHATFSNLKARW